jgi:hypothetical protein
MRRVAVSGRGRRAGCRPWSGAFELRRGVLQLGGAWWTWEWTDLQVLSGGHCSLVVIAGEMPLVAVECFT